MDISVIIPTWNEAANIGKLIRHLQQNCHFSGEIIVADGGSQDETLDIARAMGARALRSPDRGRGPQMNYAARLARHDLLYFVHADALPPADFSRHITQAIREGYSIGCFTYRFDSDRWLLRINSWFTRLDRIWCRGGDQTLFIQRDAFEQMGGFRQDFIIMEDYDLIQRARQQLRFRIIRRDVIVSARKYVENSYLRVQLANFIVFNMYRFGASQRLMADTYRTLLKYRN